MEVTYPVSIIKMKHIIYSSWVSCKYNHNRSKKMQEEANTFREGPEPYRAGVGVSNYSNQWNNLINKDIQRH